MHHRKSLVAVIAILLGIVAAIPITVPRAHADDTYSSVTITGTLAKDITDSYLGVGTIYDAVQAGNTLYFNVYFVANYVVFQRNLTMGVKFDWMQNYLNTTTPVTVFAYGTATITLAVPIPNLTGQYSSLNLAGHPWTLELWDMSIGSTWTGGCFDNYNKGIACNSWTGSPYSSQYPAIAVYSGAQAAFYNNILQASQLITAIQAELGGTNPPAGSSAAAADLALARSQAYLAENAYSNGDFNTAQTDSQNALNNANAAESSLATVGGGTDAATMTSIWLGGVAVIMGGIGALLLGFGGFKYMRGKTKTMSGYSSSPKA